MTGKTGKKKALYIIFTMFIFISAVSFSFAEEGKPFYVGTKKCKICHAKQYKSWKSTKMGNAFKSLMPLELKEKKESVGLDPARDYSIDPNCLSCHTVGLGQKGGFDLKSKSEDLKDVGCESCHGPGSNYMKVMMSNPKYKKEEIIQAGLVEINEKTCRTCHNEKDPFFKITGFDYEKMLKTGVHEHFPSGKSH